MKNNGVFSCPSRGEAPNASPGSERYRYGHYGINPNLINAPKTLSPRSKALFIGEVVELWHRGEWKFGDICKSNASEFRYISVIHDGWVNYLAMDCSAHAVKVAPRRGLDCPEMRHIFSLK